MLAPRLLPVFVALSVPVAAQIERAPYDAATLSFPDNTSIVEVGDFDADGDIDGVGWYFRTDRRTDVVLRTFLNDGAGNFAEGYASNSIPYVSGQSWEVKVGTLNAAAGDDWIAAFYDRVLTSYGPGWIEPAGINGLALLDFDGDGDDDVAIWTDKLRILRNDGNGGLFEVSTVTPVRSSGEFHVADLDGNGVPDLLLADRSGVEMFLVQAEALVPGPVVPLNIAVVELPMFAAGDIDGDSDDDVVAFVDRAGGRINYAEYIVLRHDGAGGFTVEGREVGGPATGLADLDGDGDLDGTCCGGGGGALPARNAIESMFHLSLNDGTGRFAPAWTVKSIGGLRFAGYEDVDQDGDRDLIAGRSVLFNQSNFGFELQPRAALDLAQRVFDDLDGDGDVDVALDIRYRIENDASGTLTQLPVSYDLPPVGDVYGTPIAGDFDGDGDTDLITRHWHQPQLLGMRIHWNEGGRYVDGGYAANPGQIFSNGNNATDSAARYLVADLDGDGDQDVIVGNTGGLLLFRTWLNDGVGFFTLADSIFAGLPVQVLDLDGDGQQDLITTDSIHYGLGGGRLSGRTGTGIGGPTSGVLGIGDLDGNGWTDIVWAQRGINEIEILYNDGARSYRQVQLTPPVPLSNSSSRGGIDVAIVDANGDGVQDLVVGPTWWYDGYASMVWFGDGQGGFGDFVQQAFDIGRLVDMDGDGDLDLVTDRTVRSALHTPPVDGYVRQYGTEVAGSSGIVPKLGAVGPFRVGSRVELRLTNALGGAPILLLLSAVPADLADWPLPGLHGYVQPGAIAAFTATGTPAKPGGGGLSFELPIVPPMAGLRVFHQAFVLDPGAAVGVAQTGALEIQYR